jgi:NAD(P)H-hydrate epimerase
LGVPAKNDAMKILTGKQIREADRATIEREGISSLNLMERAARGLAGWIEANVDSRVRILFCCGRGGNGGDGMAVARILAGLGRDCAVLLGADPNELHPDTRANFARLPEGVPVLDITVERPDVEQDAVIVDALLGVGITGCVREPVAGIIRWINLLPNRVISIDIPSGMATEWGGAGENPDEVRNEIVVRAETTLTIEFPKLGMLFPVTGEYVGSMAIIPIDLNKRFIKESPSPYYYITPEWVGELRKPRAKFSHKGTYGHALLVCGSEAMPGAAILATGGALRSGCGLVTVHIPKNERFALSARHPSAMLSLDKAECFSTVPAGLERFSAIGVGPGLGQDARTAKALGELLNEAWAHKIPMVLDADALNIIAANTDFKRLIPSGSVLTPHPGELRRLVGEWADEREKLVKASALARETRSTVVVKGAHSVVCTSDGRFLFNSTGNPGMAKGGSGDVLTGLIAGLMARGYSGEDASVIGVYIHGQAGDRAAERHGQEAMNSADLIDYGSRGVDENHHSHIRKRGWATHPP